MRAMGLVGMLLCAAVLFSCATPADAGEPRCERGVCAVGGVAGVTLGAARLGGRAAAIATRPARGAVRYAWNAGRGQRQWLVRSGGRSLRFAGRVAAWPWRACCRRH